MVFTYFLFISRHSFIYLLANMAAEEGGVRLGCLRWTPDRPSIPSWYAGRSQGHEGAVHLPQRMNRGLGLSWVSLGPTDGPVSYLGFMVVDRPSDRYDP